VPTESEFITKIDDYCDSLSQLTLQSCDPAYEVVVLGFDLFNRVRESFHFFSMSLGRKNHHQQRSAALRAYRSII